MSTKDIDAEIDARALAAGVSPAKLRCVYARGVQDYVPGMSASMAGLLRVEKFVRALEAGNHRLTCDADLLVNSIKLPSTGPDGGIELTSEDAWPLISDVVYGDLSRVLEAFEPGVVTDIGITASGGLEVIGNLDDHSWRYTLDLETGATDFYLS